MQVLLYIFTAFILFNGFIQHGFGLVYSDNPKRAIIPIISMILSSLISWFIITHVLVFLGFGVFGVYFVFPISAICSLFVAYMAVLFRKHPSKELQHSPGTDCNGIAFFGAYQTVLLAQTAVQALFFAIGGALGFLVVISLLSGIQKRSDIEAVPRFFKGQPLLLISSGLLVLIFTELLPLVIHIIAK